MSLSKQLIHLRAVKGINQEELASLMNVTRQSVSKWETDQSFPDGEKIIQLSEIFGVTTDYLLKGTESAPADKHSESGHKSKAGADMSAEVTEILNNVHGMSNKKRLAIGLSIAAIVITVIALLLFALLHR